MYGSFSMHTDWSIQHEQPPKVHFKYSLPKFQEPPLKIHLYQTNVITLVNNPYVNEFTLRKKHIFRFSVGQKAAKLWSVKL